MEISDYEQYYQKGGTYVLPIEMFNELWGEMENWKDTCKQKENIIKEVKKYMKDNIRVKLNEEFGETMQYKTIYEKLDKENK